MRSLERRDGSRRGGRGVEKGGAPCGQYHLDKKNLPKGGAFEMRAIQMPVAFATEARQGTFDDPCIEAQAAGRQLAGAQVCSQTLQQGGTLIQSNHGELMNGLLDDFDG